MADLQKLVDDLSTLTVLEAAELSKMLEEKWGVSAAAVAAPVERVARQAEWEEIDWLVDALVPELELASGEERARLADRLIRKAGTYELADDAGENAAYNARLRLVYRIAARITAETR